MKTGRRGQRLIAVATVLAVFACLGVASASGLAVVDQELLVNGSFEGGFRQVAGCGMVGTGWGCFTNGGTADYGFYDDQWQPVVGDGKHSQLIEISTMQYAASESDRYAGIYQTVRLVKGRTYQLRVMAGMRERNPDPMEDPYRYRIEWGYTPTGSTDWRQVTNWQELPFDKIDDRTAPTGLETYTGQFTAPSKKITLFFRVWKKWGTPYKELDVNLDALSLWGPGVKHPVEPAGPVVILPGPVITDEVVVPPPADEACGGPNYIANGSFDGGFTGGVGKGWASFTNGGGAAYGFYDEMWPPVVKDGAHGQLIEINTYGISAADPDRYAGIYQIVKGLKKGATYEFSLWIEMREEAAHPDEDAFRYRVQWGYAPLTGEVSPWKITNWAEVPWDTIYLRTDPGPMAFHSAKFEAPSNEIILAVRAWKKWPTSERELNVNLDAIRLVRCPSGPEPTDVCIHVVAPKQTLLYIAATYHTTLETLIQMNDLPNPDWLDVGQRLNVPCPGRKPPAPDCSVIHDVVPGDTVSALAVSYSSTIAAIVDANHLANPNLIYVGQKLCIPGW